MADVGNSLTKAFDHVWGRFLGRLEELGDAEYFWEPVPGCWSVRQGTDGLLAALPGVRDHDFGVVIATPKS